MLQIEQMLFDCAETIIDNHKEIDNVTPVQYRVLQGHPGLEILYHIESCSVEQIDHMHIIVVYIGDLISISKEAILNKFEKCYRYVLDHNKIEIPTDI